MKKTVAVCVCFLTMGILLIFITAKSIFMKAIWRGPGIEPTILLNENKFDYCLFLTLLVFLSVSTMVGFFWLLASSLQSKKGKENNKITK